MSAPERIWANEGLEWHSFDCSDVKSGWTHPYILATPAALAASPEVANLVAEAEARVWREAAKEARECDYPWASPTNEQADACDQMAERIADWLDNRAAAAAIRGEAK